MYKTENTFFVLVTEKDIFIGGAYCTDIEIIIIFISQTDSAWHIYREVTNKWTN
jgi:hypothetical protein